MGAIDDCDGFTKYDASTQALVWPIASGFNGSMAGRVSGTARGFLNTGGSGNIRAMNFTSTSGCYQVAIFITAGPGSTEPFMTVYDGASQQLSLRLNSSRNVVLVRGSSTVLSTGATVLGTNLWHLIEFKFTINNSTGSYEVRINGTTEFSGTGADTQDTGNASFNRFGVNPMGFGINVFFSDLIIQNDQGGAPDFLGDKAVRSLGPSAAGNYAQFTPLSSTNVSNIDDSAPDGDTTYNETLTPGSKDSFQFEDLVGALGILAVKQVYVARMVNTGTVGIKPLQRIDGADYLGTEVFFGASYEAKSHMMLENPDTSSAWAMAEVNAMELGYEATSVS